MSEGSQYRVLWPQDLLQRHSLSDESRVFLTSVGLPEFVSGLSVEFGLFDSDGPDLVIGTDGEHPVCIDSTTDAVYLLDGSLNGICFVNSSVRLLDQFLCAFSSGDRSSPHHSAAQLQQRLAALDPRAMDRSGHCVWPPIIEYVQALA